MPNPKNPPRKTKAAAVNRMLRRAKGATLAEIAKATDWKPHSCRAFLSGVRKKSATITKEARPDGIVAYRVTGDSQS